VLATDSRVYAKPIICESNHRDRLFSFPAHDRKKRGFMLSPLLLLAKNPPREIGAFDELLHRHPEVMPADEFYHFYRCHYI
jgi:hypothetical protein